MSMRAVQVRVKRVQVGEREFDEIKVCIGDLHLYCVADCDRTIRLAKRLADDHEAFFWHDDASAERCRHALGIDAQKATP